MRKSFAEIDIENGGSYLKLLSAVSKLSSLFSESAIPYINYRVAENVFCRSFNAQNLSRSDTAYDANYNSLGIGLKTFTCSGAHSTEKIAEFNSLANTLKLFAGRDLAHKLAEFRNERISLATRTYDIENSLYHIVARQEKQLVLFETDYQHIDISNINSVKQNATSLQFEDGKNFYSFNFSKSTLFRKFYIPKDAFILPIEILEDPYSLLLELFEETTLPKREQDKEFVILPLYGYCKGQKFVFPRSGINQWNAAGRKRDLGEIYIPIPIEIHRKFPNFFPPRDKKFNLKVPTGEVLSSKVCQENSKALMTDPNKALSDWLLRKVLQLAEGELATIEKLNELGFDSVIITKVDDENFEIDIRKTDTFERFAEKNI